MASATPIQLSCSIEVSPTKVVVRLDLPSFLSASEVDVSLVGTSVLEVSFGQHPNRIDLPEPVDPETCKCKLRRKTAVPHLEVTLARIPPLGQGQTSPHSYASPQSYTGNLTATERADLKAQVVAQQGMIDDLTTALKQRLGNKDPTLPATVPSCQEGYPAGGDADNNTSTPSTVQVSVPAILLGQENNQSMTGAKRRLALDRLEVDEAAVIFGRDVTAILDAVSAAGPISISPLKAQPFSTDTYAKAVCKQRPVLFNGHGRQRQDGLSLSNLVHNTDHDNVRVSVKWPQLALPHGVCTIRDIRPYFNDEPLLNPPNIVDTELSAFGEETASAFELPEVVAATNMLCKCGEDSTIMHFQADLVLSPRCAITRFHVDSGFATWFEMREGSKDWAMCSLEDGLALGLHEHPHHVTLANFLKKPSAVLCRLEAGQSLFFPAGYFHFVVTREHSFGFSNNLITVGGFGVAMGLYERENNSFALDDAKKDLLVHTHKITLGVHAVECGVTTKLASRGDTPSFEPSPLETLFASVGVSASTSKLYKNNVELLWASS